MNQARELCELYRAALSFGSDIDEHYGIAYPPYPDGLNVGDIAFTLQRVHETTTDPAHATLLFHRAAETRVAFVWFLNSRWPKASRLKARTPAYIKPLGRVFEAMYDLCVATAPYVPTESDLYGVDGASWFNRCVKEIAVTGGIFAAIEALYPVGPMGQTKKDYARKINLLLSKLKALEIPEGETLGHVGALMFFALAAAEKDRVLQSRELRIFIEALRNHARQIESPKYAFVKRNTRGDLYNQRSPKHPKKILTAASTDAQSFKELTANFFTTPTPM